MTAEPIDEIFAGLNRSQRRWALPLLRALDRLGGEAKVPAVRAEVRRVVGAAMSEVQWARVDAKN